MRVLRSTSSSPNVCCRPPSKASWQSTRTESAVWLCMAQLDGAAGLPANVIVIISYAQIIWKFSRRIRKINKREISSIINGCRMTMKRRGWVVYRRSPAGPPHDTPNLDHIKVQLLCAMLCNYCYLPAGTTWKRQGSRWFPIGLLAQQATTPKSSSDFGEYCRTLALPWVVKSERDSRMASPLLVTIILPLPTQKKKTQMEEEEKKRGNYF